MGEGVIGTVARHGLDLRQKNWPVFQNNFPEGPDGTRLLGGGGALVAQPVDLFQARVWDGVDHLRKHAIPFMGMTTWNVLNVPLPITAAADDLAVIGGTFLTNAPVLQTSDAKATTVTQKARFQYRVPDDYIPGDDAKVVCVAELITTIANGTATLDLEVARVAAPGTDIQSTAAVDFKFAPGTSTTCTFVLTATDLVPGEMLDCVFTVGITDSGTGTAVIGQITSAEFQLDSQRTLLPTVAENDDLALILGTFLTDDPLLQTSNADGTTVTQKARFQIVVPEWYIPDNDAKIVINAGLATTVATGTATVDIQAVRQGAPTVDIVATAAQSINSLTAADKTFVLTDTNLVAGDVLDCIVTIAITDDGTGGAKFGQINKVKPQFDSI